MLGVMTYPWPMCWRWRCNYSSKTSLMQIAVEVGCGWVEIVSFTEEIHQVILSMFLSCDESITCKCIINVLPSVLSPSMGLNKDLSPDRRQAIIWTNAELIHRRIYAALGGGGGVNVLCVKNAVYQLGRLENEFKHMGRTGSWRGSLFSSLFCEMAHFLQGFYYWPEKAAERTVDLAWCVADQGFRNIKKDARRVTLSFNVLDPAKL